MQSFHGHSGDVMSIDLSPTEMGNTFVSAVSDAATMIPRSETVTLFGRVRLAPNVRLAIQI